MLASRNGGGVTWVGGRRGAGLRERGPIAPPYPLSLRGTCWARQNSGALTESTQVLSPSRPGFFRRDPRGVRTGAPGIAFAESTRRPYPSSYGLPYEHGRLGDSSRDFRQLSPDFFFQWTSRSLPRKARAERSNLV